MPNEKTAAISPPRVRFAPSPTGYLHVGGARTALFNWLFARRHGGTFILRIEDTDIARSSDEMVGAILEGLDWLRLGHDEGPFYQTASRETHRRRARSLLEAGRGYRCFCEQEALAERKRRMEGQGGAWKYDRTCAGIESAVSNQRAEAGEVHCVRFLVPDGTTVYRDLVHGETRFENSEVEDLVLLRSDGSPTYNLSCVSDDLDMRITHVVRGDDHISNTPKQLLLYRALGAEPPQFAHLPLILGEDRKRLSKRHGAVAVVDYRVEGYLPEALVNFLGLLGWSPGDDRELMSAEEMTAAFSFEGVSTRNAVFDHGKLAWMNGEYIKRRPGADLVPLVRPFLEKEGLWTADLEEARSGWFARLLDLLKERCRLVGDLARDARPFLSEDFAYDPAAASKHLAAPEAADRLRALASRLHGTEEFDEPACEAALRGLAAESGIKAAALIHPARVALTGNMVSAGIFAVMVAMGRDGTIVRLERAARHVETAGRGAS